MTTRKNSVKGYSLMTALTLSRWEDISRFNNIGVLDRKEREKQIINQRRRQQYKK